MVITDLQVTDSAPVNEVLQLHVDWERLFREQQRRLHRFIRKRVNNREDAEDLEQMTWLEVLRNRDKFAGASRPETWVFGIALNLVRNHFRLQAGRPHYDELEEESVLTHGDDPCDITEHQRVLTATLNSIANLPEDTRHLLSILVEHDGSYQAIASHLNIPIGTVRSRLSRVRTTLRQSVFV